MQADRLGCQTLRLLSQISLLHSKAQSGIIAVWHYRSLAATGFGIISLLGERLNLCAH